MEIQEKIHRVKNLFNQQKEVLSEINIENFGESIIKIRKLELEKEIVKAIPTNKKTANKSGFFIHISLKIIYNI